MGTKLNFWMGALFATFFACMRQDYMGKSEYMHEVDTHWVDISWGWWIIPILIVLLISVLIERKEDRK